MNKLQQFCKLLKSAEPSLRFDSLEIGAIPMKEEIEPLHEVASYLDSSLITAFEPDTELCKSLNQKCPDYLNYVPEAVGKRVGTEDFYITRSRLCCSLYEPNVELGDHYMALEDIHVQSKTQVDITTVDHLIADQKIRQPDLIKMDIQGAELDVLEGAQSNLKDLLFVVTEVEFVPLYKGQPLYGDIEGFLRQHGFMHHKFSGGFSGRSMKPLMLGKDATASTQNLWADAIFIRDITKSDELSDIQLLRAALFAIVYMSADLCYFYLNHYDSRNNTTLKEQYMAILSG